MPPKKAAKKAAKKVAKKFARHHPLHDLRRAYEHLGRVDILEGALAGQSYLDVAALANLAQQQLDSGHAKNAADLLRAAEHISFAALAPRESSHISSELADAISAELNHLTHRAEDRWADADFRVNRKVIADLYTRTLELARQAFDHGAYRPALELTRAAEALSNITHGLPATLPGARELIRRIAS